MTDSARTEEIRARVEKATGGKWWWYQDGGSRLLRATRISPHRTILELSGTDDSTEADRDFLVHARSDVPYLLTELTALREEVERVRGALEKYGGHHLDCDQLKLHGGSECSCGFDAALSPSPAQQEAK